MKKGASHIDWAISMGIFLIAIITLLIFFRPGTQEEFDDNRLIEILELGLMNNVHTEVEIVPVFINLTDTDNGRYGIEITGAVPISGDNEDFTMFNTSNDIVPFTMSGGSSNKIIRFDGRVIKNVLNKFFLYHSVDADYNNNNPSEDVKIVDGDNFTYKYGVVQTIEGIKEENLTALSSYNYEDLKELFNYPSNKDFSVFVYGSKNLKYSDTDLIFSYENLEPEQENIFVKESKDWILNQNGSKKDVVVNLRVW